jgi:hypothetical protein
MWQSFESHMLGAMQFDQRISDGDGDLHTIDFTRAIEFTQQVVGVEPLADAIAVVVIGWFHGDDTRLGIDRFDSLSLIGPIPEPVAVHPRIGFVQPP